MVCDPDTFLASAFGKLLGGSYSLVLEITQAFFLVSSSIIKLLEDLMFLKSRDLSSRPSDIVHEKKTKL